MPLYRQHIEFLHEKARHFLLNHHLDALILTTGAPQFYYDDDQEIPHRTPASFRHWVPEIIGTHQYLVITQEKRTLYSYRPLDFWLKVKNELGTWSNEFIVQPHTELKAIQNILSTLANTKKIIWLGPDCLDLPDDLRAKLEQKQEIDVWRLIKTPYEIECLQIASTRAATAHLAVSESLSEYISEFQMNLDYLDVSGLRESELPYGNIIAYNENASILHYQKLDQNPPTTLYSFLIDAGASYDGYIADITRTHSGDDANELFKTLLKEVRRIKLELITICNMGTSYLDIHHKALELLGALLIKHQFIINTNTQEAIEKGLVRIFFPHGIGHLLGLNTHDTPSIAKSLKETTETFKNLRLTQTLQNGMVLTIEPGIYFNNTLINEAKTDHKKAKHLNLALIESFLVYGGIRDEDNIIINDNDPINLTADAFKRIGAEGF